MVVEGHAMPCSQGSHEFTEEEELAMLCRILGMIPVDEAVVDINRLNIFISCSLSSFLLLCFQVGPVSTASPLLVNAFLSQFSYTCKVKR